MLNYIRIHRRLALWLLCSLLCYASAWIDPAASSLAVLVSYLIPAVLVTNIVLLIWMAIRKNPAAWIPVIALALGGNSILKTFTIHSAAHDGSEISVLSFNAKLFRKHNTYGEFSTETIRWVARDSSAIKCIQEYSTDSIWASLNVTRQVMARGYNAFVWKGKMANNEHDRGLAIFSTYRILNQGVVWDDSTTFNGAIFADLHVRSDTVRVYCVHLASMNVDPSDFRSANNYAGKITKVVQQLTSGAVKRSAQISLLTTHVRKCHYPVLICGDFNELPYSHNYNRMDATFRNAFETSGTGFGFTYNSRSLPLRIDHQFFSENLNCIRFSVDRTMDVSDHFPTRGAYLVTKKD